MVLEPISGSSGNKRSLQHLDSRKAEVFTPEPPGSLTASLSGMARADVTPRSPRDSGGFLVLSHFCIQFPLSIRVHRGRRLTPPLPRGLTFNF